MSSSALAYRHSMGVVENNATTAGKMWLRCLYELYHFFFTTAEAVDSGRYSLMGSNLTPAQWVWNTNVTNNSWFVVRNNKGRYDGVNPVQFKFQATNNVALDEAPGITYALIVSGICDGVWAMKGGPNGGWAGAEVFTGNLLLGGLNPLGQPSGSIIVHGDRDTILIAIARSGINEFNAGGYVGRYVRESDQVKFPMCILTAWNNVGDCKGFDRSAGGVFGLTPSGSALYNEGSPHPVINNAHCWTSGWMNTTYEPSTYNGLYHYRPIEITSLHSFAGTLRLVWSCAALASRTRIDANQKLVLHGAHIDDGVCIVHDGTFVS